MNKIFRYKDYSPDEINEQQTFYSPDVVYELRGIDINGDEYVPKYEDNDANYNPYDLKEMVKLLIKKRSNEFTSKYHSANLFIVKVTTEKVPQDKLEQIRIEIEGDKYNL